MEQPSQTGFSRYRDDLIVLLLMGGGFALNLYAPIWLAPPLFEYSFWLYLVLFFAWMPVYILLMRRKRRRRVALFAVLGAVLTLFACMVLIPASLFGWTFVTDSINCEQQPTVAGQARYACTHDYFSSDSEVFDPTLVLAGPEWSPILFVVETDWRSMRTQSPR